MMTTTSSPLARSPLHAWQEAQGARFTQRHGWWLAESFAEATSAGDMRAELLLADVTPFAKLAFTGNDVPGLARAALADPQPGKVTVLQGPKPGWLCYLSEDHLLFLSTQLDEAGLGEFRLPNQPDDARPATWDVTSAYAGFMLIGADAAKILGSQMNLGGGPTTLPPGTCVETGFFGAPCLLARPPDERPVVGIWVSWDVAEYAWERLRQAAAKHRLLTLGSDALREFGWHA